MCLGSMTVSAREEIRISKEREVAEKEYKLFLASMKAVEDFAVPIRDGKDDENAIRRGLLLGRHEKASWEEVVVARLVWDLLDDGKEDPGHNHNIVRQKLTKGAEIDALVNATNSLLDKYPVKVQVAFRGCYNKSLSVDLVKNMFGLTRKWKGKVKKVNLLGTDHSIHFRKRVIEKAYELAFTNIIHGRPTVNSDLATKAHHFAVTNPQSDLNKLMEGTEFVEKVKAALGERFLDDDPSNEELPFNLAMDNGHKVNHPVVDHHVVESEGAKAWYLVVNNPISSGGVKQLWEYVGDTPWLFGKAGKKRSMYRVVTEGGGGDNAPAFVVGGKTAYPSDVGGRHQKFESAMIGWSNQILRQLVSAMKVIHPNARITDTCWSNMAQMLVGQINDASYSAHNDFECTIAIRENEDAVEVMEDVFLPTIDNLIVVTYVLTNDTNVGNCYLEIIDENGKVIGKIPMSNNCFHVQGPGANRPGWEHKVCFTEVKMEGGIWRLSITFRLCIDGRINPTQCEELLKKALQHNQARYNDRGCSSDYKDPEKSKSKVMSAITLCDCPSSSDDDKTSPSGSSDDESDSDSSEGGNSSNAPMLAALNYKDDAHNDLFQHVRPQDYLKLVGRPIMALAALWGPERLHMMGQRLTRMLFREGYLVNKVPWTGASIDFEKAVPLLHLVPTMTADECEVISHEEVPSIIANKRFPCPGDVFDESKIARDGGMSHADRSHVITSGIPTSSNIVMPAYKYKNSWKKFVDLIAKAEHWKKDPDNREYCEPMEELGFICGCGGMPLGQGEYAPDASKMNKDDPVIVVGEGQKLDSKMNKILYEYWETGAVFALYLNKTRFMLEIAATKNGQQTRPTCDKSIFLGYCWFSSCQECIDQPEQLEQEFEELEASRHHRLLSKFREGRYRKFWVSSVFGTEDYRRFNHMGPDSFEQLHVPLGTGPSCVSANVPIDVIARNDVTPLSVLQEFMAHRGYEKYQKDQVDKLLAKTSKKDATTTDATTTMENTTLPSPDEEEIELEEDDDKPLATLHNIVSQWTDTDNDTEDDATVNEASGQSQDVNNSQEDDALPTASFSEDNSVEELPPWFSASFFQSRIKSYIYYCQHDLDEISMMNIFAMMKEASGHELTNSCRRYIRGIVGDLCNRMSRGMALTIDNDSFHTCSLPDQSLKGTKATVDDIIGAAVVCEVAGSLRYVGESIVDQALQDKLDELHDDDPDTKPRQYYNESDPLTGDHAKAFKRGSHAVPLCRGIAKHLNQGASRNATPMACPTSDRNISFLMEEMERRGYHRETGGLFKLPEDNIDNYRKAMLDTLFSNFIFRILGRTEPYEHYGRRNHLPNFIPKPDQLLTWVSTLRVDYGEDANLKKRKRNGKKKSKPNRATAWVSSQHQGVIPSEWFNVGHLEDKLPRVLHEMDARLKEFFETHKEALDLEKGKFINYQRQDGTQTDLFQEMVEIVTDLFRSNSQKFPLKKHAWLPTSIVSDLYELFDEPFGPIQSRHLVAGWGSGQCLVMLQNMGLFCRKENSRKNFANALEAVVQKVWSLPQSLLELLKLFRDDSNVVRHRINGVRFGYKHAEHYMCKFAVQVKFTWSNYRRTPYPKASSPHCWPRKWRQFNSDNHTKVMEELSRLMQRTVDVYQQTMGNGGPEEKHWVTVPKILVLSGESLPRKTFDC